jgi:hypothetical protein
LNGVIGIDFGYLFAEYQKRSRPEGMPSENASIYWSQVPLKFEQNSM